METAETDILYTVGGSVGTVVLGLIVYVCKNKLKHSKLKCFSRCCEFSAQEDSFRKETARLEDLNQILKDRIKLLERNAKRKVVREGEGSLTSTLELEPAREGYEEKKSGKTVERGSEVGEQNV